MEAVIVTRYWHCFGEPAGLDSLLNQWAFQTCTGHKVYPASAAFRIMQDITNLVKSWGIPRYKSPLFRAKNDHGNFSNEMLDLRPKSGIMNCSHGYARSTPPGSPLPGSISRCHPFPRVLQPFWFFRSLTLCSLRGQS